MKQDTLEIIEQTKDKANNIYNELGEHSPLLMALTDDSECFVNMGDFVQPKLFNEFVPSLLRYIGAKTYLFMCQYKTYIVSKDSPESGLKGDKLKSGEITMASIPSDDITQMFAIVACENKGDCHIWVNKLKYTKDGNRLTEWKLTEPIKNEYIIRSW